MPNFWHAPTANERGWSMPAEDGQWLLASRYATFTGGPDNPEVARAGGAVELRYRYHLPTVPASESEVRYRVHGDGQIEVSVSVAPGDGLPDLPEFGMLFTVPAALDRLRWYGDGPDECYIDRRQGARLGVYERQIAAELTPYLRPQEAGSRTRVRWAEVTGEGGAGLRFECPTGMEFSALPWTPFEIENAAHHFELPPITKTVLRPALMRRGVAGDDSWGARPHPQHLLPPGPLRFEFSFRGIGAYPPEVAPTVGSANSRAEVSPDIPAEFTSRPHQSGGTSQIEVCGKEATWAKN
jgi:beta-galactosidase